MSLPGYLSEQEQAERLNKSIRTLRIWRQRREGPPWVKNGKTVLYPDSLDWLKAKIQEPVRSRRQRTA